MTNNIYHIVGVLTVNHARQYLVCLEDQLPIRKSASTITFNLSFFILVAGIPRRSCFKSKFPLRQWLNQSYLTVPGSKCSIKQFNIIRTVSLELVPR